MALALTASGQAPAAKNWKDRAEYDLYEAITKDNAPASRLTNLDKWKAGYAQSDYADVRTKIYLVTYVQMNNHRAAVDTAVEILKSDPNDYAALSEIVGNGLMLEPTAANAQLNAQNKADLETIEKAAHYLIENIDKIEKPAGTADDKWNEAKAQLPKYVQGKLVAAVMTDKATAETELTKAVKADPTNTPATQALAKFLLDQQKTNPEKVPAALYQYARLAAYEGPGALDANGRKSVDAFVTKAYTAYHGSAQGLDQLKMLAKAAPMPPDGFAIKSTVDLAKDAEEKRQQALKEDPMKAFWSETKDNLTGDKAADLWESNYKDAGLPAAGLGFTKFKGKLVSAEPETKPKTLTIAVESDAANVKLVLAEPLPGKMEPGGDISFSGALKEYSKDPYMLTFEVEAMDIEGWTGKGAVPARGAAKKAAPAAPKKQQ
jgi:tetratricopeptide (TPR) repeat protein